MERSGVCNLCGSETTQKCGSCQEVFYCSKEHQKKDWKQHKTSCRPFTVEECPELGKYIEASRPVPVGNVVMTDSPLVVGPVWDSLPVCLGCYKRVDGSYKCSKCNFPLCEKKCEDMIDHQAECQIVQTYKVRINIYSFNEPNMLYQPILVLRVLAIKWKKEMEKWNQVLEMESHLEERRDTPVFQHETDNILKMIRNNYKMTEFTDDEIHTVCGIVDVNALEIRLVESEIMALYPTAYMMQHDCTPNTKQSFDTGGKLTIRAAVAIKPGEKITTLHTNALWATHARRDHLKCFKYYTCLCKRCKDPSELGTEFGTLICQEKYGTDGPCKGLVRSIDPLDDSSDWRCEKCRALLTAGKMASLNVSIGEKVEGLQSSMSFSTEDYEKLMTTLLKVVHPNHYQLFPVKHSLLQMYGRDGKPLQEVGQEVLDKKTKLCNDVLYIIDKLDPGNARLTVYKAVTLLELHLTMVEQAQRLVNEDAEDKTKAENLSSDAGEALLKAKTALEGATDGAEAQIAEVVEESYLHFQKWVQVAGLQ